MPISGVKAKAKPIMAPRAEYSGECRERWMGTIKRNLISRFRSSNHVLFLRTPEDPFVEAGLSMTNNLRKYTPIWLISFLLYHFISPTPFFKEEFYGETLHKLLKTHIQKHIKKKRYRNNAL
jgi:hypothetical protein